MVGGDDGSVDYKNILQQIELSAFDVLNKVNLSSELYNAETENYNLIERPVVIEEILKKIIENFFNRIFS